MADNRRFELQGTLSDYEKKQMRECGIRFDRLSGLYMADYGQNIYDAVKNAMLKMHRTFNVRYTHINPTTGQECPCFSARHAEGR